MNVSTRTAITALGLTLAAALTTSGIALAQVSTDEASVIELCAATDIEAVDTILDGLADSDLIGDLEPLLDLTVPSESDGLDLDLNLNTERDEDFDRDAFRSALGCDDLVVVPPVTTSPVPTDIEEPTPTVDPEPTTPTRTPGGSDIDDSDDNDNDFDQIDRVPSGSAATGGGPA